MQKVWDSRLNESNKMVMLVLASDANDDGFGVLTNMDDVLQRTSMTEDEICREFSELNAAGVIHLEKRADLPSALYKINAEALKKTKGKHTSNEVAL